MARARTFAPLGSAHASRAHFGRNQLCSIDDTSSLSLKVPDGEDALASTRGACAPRNIRGVCQFRVHWHPFCCDLKAWTFEIAVPREKFSGILVGAVHRTACLGGFGPGQAIEVNRLYLDASRVKNDDRIPHTHEVFHARGVPVGEANATVARSAANRLRIIRAVNTDSGFVQAHP